MALLTHGELPFSIDDLKVFPFSGGTPGTGKDVPGIRRLELAAAIEETEHRGDNTILAVAASFGSVDLTIEVGTFNEDAIAALSGGTVTTSGTTPNQMRTLVRKSLDVLPDYAIKGIAASKSIDGGAMVLSFPRCQWVDGPSYSMADVEFPVITIGARAIPDATDVLYKAIQQETYTAISTTWS